MARLKVATEYHLGTPQARNKRDYDRHWQFKASFQEGQRIYLGKSRGVALALKASQDAPYCITLFTMPPHSMPLVNFSRDNVTSRLRGRRRLRLSVLLRDVSCFSAVASLEEDIWVSHASNSASVLTSWSELLMRASSLIELEIPFYCANYCSAESLFTGRSFSLSENTRGGEPAGRAGLCAGKALCRRPSTTHQGDSPFESLKFKI